jgi:hypothetical protein
MGISKKVKNLDYYLRRRKIWFSFPPLVMVYSIPVFLIAQLLKDATTTPLGIIRFVIITVAVLATIIVILMLIPSGPLKMDGSHDLRYSSNRAWLTSKVMWVLFPAFLYFAYFQLEPIDKWLQVFLNKVDYLLIFVLFVVGIALLQGAGLSLNRVQIERFKLTPEGARELSERGGWINSISNPATRELARKLHEWRYKTGDGPLSNGLQVMKLKKLIRESESLGQGQNHRFDQLKSKIGLELEGISRRRPSFARIHRNFGLIYRWPFSLLVLYFAWNLSSSVYFSVERWFSAGIEPKLNELFFTIIASVLFYWVGLVQFFPNKVELNRLSLRPLDRAAETWLNFFHVFAFLGSLFRRTKS